MKVMRLLKKISLCILIPTVYGLSVNGQERGNIPVIDNIVIFDWPLEIAPIEPDKIESDKITSFKVDILNVQARRNNIVKPLPTKAFVLPAIINGDLPIAIAEIDPVTRGQEMQGRKANENIEINEILEIKLYPNPCQNYMNIGYILADESEVHIAIYNTLGRKVINQKEYQLAGEHRAEMDISHLANGTYICRVSQSNGEVASQRFVKMQ